MGEVHMKHSVENWSRGHDPLTEGPLVWRRRVRGPGQHGVDPGQKGLAMQGGLATKGPALHPALEGALGRPLAWPRDTALSTTAGAALSIAAGGSP